MRGLAPDYLAPVGEREAVQGFFSALFDRVFDGFVFGFGLGFGVTGAFALLGLAWR